MRDEDRVAIHEVMEQQTISIAKAGITTVLSSRTRVLQLLIENIDFQTIILFPFDIFIVRDEHNGQRSRTIAKYVMNIHMSRPNTEDVLGEIEIDRMKKYIAYCKLEG
ncbi:hypothetical protein M422DRAFT_153744 [Sphaerobolus stellatus SS14]|nr:hypothetical protein M422DRAFT_153744 [Sphaerobolus stellatus SS14]